MILTGECRPAPRSGSGCPFGSRSRRRPSRSRRSASRRASGQQDDRVRRARRGTCRSRRELAPRELQRPGPDAGAVTLLDRRAGRDATPRRRVERHGVLAGAHDLRTVLAGHLPDASRLRHAPLRGEGDVRRGGVRRWTSVHGQARATPFHVEGAGLPLRKGQRHLTADDVPAEALGAVVEGHVYDIGVRRIDARRVRHPLSSALGAAASCAETRGSADVTWASPSTSMPAPSAAAEDAAASSSSSVACEAHPPIERRNRVAHATVEMARMVMVDSSLSAHVSRRAAPTFIRPILFFRPAATSGGPGEVGCRRNEGLVKGGGIR